MVDILNIKIIINWIIKISTTDIFIGMYSKGSGIILIKRLNFSFKYIQKYVNSNPRFIKMAPINVLKINI